MAWEQGRATVENLIKTGMLERVPPNVDAARSLVAVAETHLASALMLAGSDTVLADHPGCQKIVDIAKRVIGQMPPF